MISPSTNYALKAKEPFTTDFKHSLGGYNKGFYNLKGYSVGRSELRVEVARDLLTRLFGTLRFGRLQCERLQRARLQFRIV